MRDLGQRYLIGKGGFKKIRAKRYGTGLTEKHCSQTSSSLGFFRVSNSKIVVTTRLEKCVSAAGMQPGRGRGVTEILSLPRL